MGKPLKTSEAQRNATQAYQEGRERFILWYPKETKERISAELEKRGLLPREAFEAGLVALGIKVPGMKKGGN